MQDPPSRPRKVAYCRTRFTQPMRPNRRASSPYWSASRSRHRVEMRNVRGECETESALISNILACHTGPFFNPVAIGRSLPLAGTGQYSFSFDTGLLWPTCASDAGLEPSRQRPQRPLNSALRGASSFDWANSGTVKKQENGSCSGT